MSTARNFIAGGVTNGVSVDRCTGESLSGAKTSVGLQAFHKIPAPQDLVGGLQRNEGTVAAALQFFL